MTVNAWKTNFIGLHKPPKVISAYASDVLNQDYWPYSLGSDDPYWSGGTTPVPYRYRVTFTFEDQTHGSQLTRTPFNYNGQDIEVGDFVAGADDGKVLQVISILSKSDYEIVAIIEDNLRYNVYKTGTSVFNIPGYVVFFQINELGIPMLDPLPGTVSSSFYANVTSRFQYMNPLTNYVLEKENHNFEQGDAICIENGEFVLSDPDNISTFVGTVIQPGPGPNMFILRPANGIIDFVPNLPGSVGDYIYPSLDGSGNLTTDDNSKRPVYMKISDAIVTETIGTGSDPTGSDGDIVELNRVRVTLSSGSGTYNLDTAISDINGSTSFHKITADKVNAATTVTSNIAGLGSAYGAVAGYVPFSASINGVTVNFTTTSSGSIVFSDITVADVVDMAYDINQANITNIVASVDVNNNLIITNVLGGAITITNISSDTNSKPFAGANSISSLTLNTSANTTSFCLRLRREDGGPMALRDYQGLFFYNAGVKSGQNGRYALGLQIEQGLRSSTTTVVPTIPARDALYALTGDQAYVLDDGNGEWALYVWDGSNWVSVATQRSNANDARTITTTFDLASIPSTGDTQLSLGYVTSGRTISEVVVLVTSACPSGSTVKVGTATEPDLLFAEQDARLYETGSYSTDPEYQTNSYVEIFATLAQTQLGTGEVTVIVNYS